MEPKTERKTFLEQVDPEEAKRIAQNLLSKKNTYTHTPTDTPTSAEEDDYEYPALVSITARIPVEVSKGLRKAFIEQKRKGKEPFTRQGIIAEAIAEWLRNCGYLG
jgi:hypothetical protein